LRVVLSSGHDIVDEVAFDVFAGEALALVGESGCGKTTTALACLGFARPGTVIAGGEVSVGDTDVLTLRGSALREFRGRSVSYVPQDPTTALNPSLPIGRQIEEMLEVHAPTVTRRKERVAEMLAAVHLPSDQRFRQRYPHQLSGGQQQRVVIAIALSCEPRLMVLDEPTTGLDVTTQSRILELFGEVRRTYGIAMLYVTHDLAVVSQLADRVAVMYSGRIVEQGTRRAILGQPLHPYTQRLLDAAPATIEHRRLLKGIPGTAVAPGHRQTGCFFAPRCGHARALCEEEFPPVETLGTSHSVRCHRWREVSYEPTVDAPSAGVEEQPAEAPILLVKNLRAGYTTRDRERAVVALTNINFSLARNETLGIVGESGSGKTTLARCIVGLHSPAEGSIVFDGVAMAPRARDRAGSLRRRIQIVFQNPDGSLNPRHTVHQIVGRPLHLFLDLRGPELATKAADLLELVRLPRTALTKYPRDLSGGEKQRVAIATALAPEPELLVCDEVTSALDVSVQAAVIELLADLRASRGLAMIFISHDLAVVRSIADQVIVLEAGHIRDRGSVETVFRDPSHPYTKTLIEAIPQIEAGGESAGLLSSRVNFDEH
jgi:peptide/nickel transport system ATP-binding protein